jgi:metallo-beta-lactamase family protein
MPITLTSHGAAGTVTGSKHLLEITRTDGRNTRLLLDCGMFQGEAITEAKGKDPNRHFGFEPGDIDVLVLSHAHIDHSGLLPRLVAEGFSGPIWSTPATHALCSIMLEDSARIQEYDYTYDVKRAKKRGRPLPAEGPLYTVNDVQPALALFQLADYGEQVEIAPGMTLKFSDAGHILGSAVVHLVIDDGTDVTKLTFTGDVGRYVERIIPEPAPFPQSDVIICESTYGDRDHAPIRDAEDELLKHVTEVCVDRKGKLIIPAFSIGKTQDILYTLNKLSNEGRLPRIPVYVDSPLAIGATEIVERFTKLFSQAVREELRIDPDLFSFPGVSFVREADQSKQLNDRKEPCIIVSASGMMEAGRVRHHLRNNLPDPANGVLAVGFCAPGTLGARLLSGAREVHIFGEPVPVNASIARMDFYSAHGDRHELIRFLSCQDPSKVKHLFLVHGVEHSLLGLKDLSLAQGFKQVSIPRKGEHFLL